MPIEINATLVEHIARLSRLELTPAELAEMGEHFEKVLRYIEALDELDTSAVDPSIFPRETYNVLAADEPRPSLGSEGALSNAPASRDGYFLVPRIIQES